MLDIFSDIVAGAVQRSGHLFRLNSISHLCGGLGQRIKILLEAPSVGFHREITWKTTVSIWVAVPVAFVSKRLPRLRSHKRPAMLWGPYFTTRPAYVPSQHHPKRCWSCSEGKPKENSHEREATGTCCCLGSSTQPAIVPINTGNKAPQNQTRHFPKRPWLPRFLFASSEAGRFAPGQADMAMGQNRFSNGW